MSAATGLWKRDALEVTDSEGAVLHELARHVPAHLAIVEIGSYRGRSTCFLAGGAFAGSCPAVYAVDLWTDGPGYAVVEVGSRLDRPYANQETRDAFDAAVSRRGRGLVTALQGASVEVARDFTLPVGLLFVDGSHATADVLADIQMWAPKVERGGVIVFHDYQAGTVRAAVDQALATDPGWTEETSDERRLGIFRRVA